MASDFTHENVVNLTADRRSILNLYRALIALRKQHAALVGGSYRSITAQGDVLLYRREVQERVSLLISGNTHPNCTLVPYATVEEVEQFIASSLGR